MKAEISIATFWKISSDIIAGLFWQQISKYDQWFLLCRKKIQNGADGHCSIEDAKACMELVQLKIQNGKLPSQFIFIHQK